MEKWIKICSLLCLFGLLKELRPSEPFLTQYLTGPWKNFTTDQIYSEIFPVWTYSYLSVLVVVFLVTDYLLFKPVIVFEGIAFVMTWCVLIWGESLSAFQGVEFLYAVATATQVAYSTYIYAMVPLSHFQVVTGYTQAALLSGRCLGGVLGQTLVATGLCDYYTLNFISLSCMILATLVACFLPSVDRSIYFHRGSNVDNQASKESGTVLETGGMACEITEPESNILRAFNLLWHNFVTSFSNQYLLKWSIWWAFAMCGYFQVLNYIQPLWETVAPTGTTATYHGAVEALLSFLSATAAIAIGYAPLDWSVLGEPVIAFISIFEGIMLFFAGSANSLWITYITYMAFNISYSVLITIASSEVARELKQETYGLVFGFNTFLALVFQTILTMIVADSVGLALHPKSQFKVYGGYYVILGAAFLLMSIIKVVRNRRM